MAPLNLALFVTTVPTKQAPRSEAAEATVFEITKPFRVCTLSYSEELQASRPMVSKLKLRYTVMLVFGHGSA